MLTAQKIISILRPKGSLVNIDLLDDTIMDIWLSGSDLPPTIMPLVKLVPWHLEMPSSPGKSVDSGKPWKPFCNLGHCLIN